MYQLIHAFLFERDSGIPFNSISPDFSNSEEQALAVAKRVSAARFVTLSVVLKSSKIDTLPLGRQKINIVPSQTRESERTTMA